MKTEQNCGEELIGNEAGLAAEAASKRRMSRWKIKGGRNMKVGIIGAGTMGSGIAQAFAMTDGYEVCLCDIKEEYAEGGKAKILKNLNFLVGKEKITQEKADEIMGKITTGLNNICTDCDLIVEVALEKLDIKQNIFKEMIAIKRRNRNKKF